MNYEIRMKHVQHKHYLKKRMKYFSKLKSTFSFFLKYDA